MSRKFFISILALLLVLVMAVSASADSAGTEEGDVSEQPQPMPETTNPAHIHEYIYESHLATCLEAGYKKTSCATCDYYQDVEMLASPGHAYHLESDGDDSATYICTVCGDSDMPEDEAEQARDDELYLSAGQSVILVDEPVVLAAGFSRIVESNAAVLMFSFEPGLFEYVGFTPAENVTVLELRANEQPGVVTVVVMVEDYQALVYGSITLRVKESPPQAAAVSLSCDYAIRGQMGEKDICTAWAEAALTIGGLRGDTDGDGVITLIDLSNIIDMFGMTAEHPEWARYAPYDFNDDEQIDILDITHIAQSVI